MGKIEREIYIICNYEWDSPCPDIRSTFEGVIKYFQEDCGEFGVEEIPNDVNLDDLDELICDYGYSIYKQTVTFYED